MRRAGTQSALFAVLGSLLAAAPAAGDRSVLVREAGDKPTFELVSAKPGG
jgi:hypothetical protein